jgi:hypothetical protein
MPLWKYLICKKNSALKGINMPTDKIIWNKDSCHYSKGRMAGIQFPAGKRFFSAAELGWAAH